MSTANASPASVDVIVPFHDQGAWLWQAGLSLVQQTYTNWRALLINDGSGSDALAAAAALCRRDPRFQLLHRRGPKPAPGPWQARNLGIDAATAPLVAFLDADDLWHPLKLERQLPLHQDDAGADVITVCSYHRFQASSRTLMETRHPPQELDMTRLFRGNVIPMSSVILTRTLLLRSGGFRPERHEDYGLWLRLFAAAPPPRYRCLPEPLMAYRLHPHSISAARHSSLLAVDQLLRQHLPRRRQRWPALLRWGLERTMPLLPQPWPCQGLHRSAPPSLPPCFLNLLSAHLDAPGAEAPPRTTPDAPGSSAP